VRKNKLASTHADASLRQNAAVTLLEACLKVVWNRSLAAIG
jgi:hypothetical protein